MHNYDPRDHYAEPTNEEILAGGSLMGRKIPETTIPRRRFPKPIEPIVDDRDQIIRENERERDRDDDRRETEQAERDNDKEVSAQPGVASGGSGDSGNAAGGNQAAGSSTTEPQKNDPDDGEHTDSTESQVEARQAQEVKRAEAAEEVEEPPARVAPPEPVAIVAAPTVEPLPESAPEARESGVSPEMSRADDRSVRERLQGISGSREVVLEKTKVDIGENTVSVKVPNEIVGHLRLSIAETAGGDFAENIPAASLIAAFLLSRTGVDLDVDSNTRTAIDLFREADPRLLSVEQMVYEVMVHINSMSRVVNNSNSRLIATEKVADSTEAGVAWLLADRAFVLETHNLTPENLDVTDKTVLQVRQRMQSGSKEQRRIERDAEGRDNK